MANQEHTAGQTAALVDGIEPRLIPPERHAHLAAMKLGRASALIEVIKRMANAGIIHSKKYTVHVNKCVETANDNVHQVLNLCWAGGFEGVDSSMLDRAWGILVCLDTVLWEEGWDEPIANLPSVLMALESAQQVIDDCLAGLSPATTPPTQH